MAKGVSLRFRRRVLNGMPLFLCPDLSAKQKHNYLQNLSLKETCYVVNLTAGTLSEHIFLHYTVNGFKVLNYYRCMHCKNYVLFRDKQEALAKQLLVVLDKFVKLTIAAKECEQLFNSIKQQVINNHE